MNPSITVGPEPGASKYFYQRLADLTAFDNTRLNQILELTQYSITYSISTILLGLGMNITFSAYNDKISTWRLFGEIILELAVLTIAVFYIRKLNQLIPFMFHINNGTSSYKPYMTTEYQGEIALSIIFVGVQFRLVRKLALFAQRLAQILVGEMKAKNELEAVIHNALGTVAEDFKKAAKPQL
jgi:hypothetical protein